MRVLVTLVSSNQGACDLFRNRKDAVIPRSLRELPRIKALGLDFFTGVYDPSKAERSIQDYVLDAAKTADVVALLVDSTVNHVGAPVAAACFLGTAVFDFNAKNYDNFISGTLTKLIKNLAAVVEAMTSAGNQLPLLLPFRNFVAEDWTALKATFRDDGLTSEFPSRFRELIGAINKRKRPHNRSSYRNTYLVDDQDKLFEYGKEHHAQLATGSPHSSMCVLTGNFRFGQRIPTNRHYNVTKESGTGTKISGSFPDCHDALIEVADRSHLNMFSNDYHA